MPSLPALRRSIGRVLLGGLMLTGLQLAAAQAISGPQQTRINLEGQTAQPLRYTPDGEDFVIHNGAEFFNRPLYGGRTGFRVDGGDKPEFILYLPGRGGNLRLAVRTPAGARWLHEATSITTRYRPGELHHDIRDPLLGDKGSLALVAVATSGTEGLLIRAEGRALPAGTELVWAYGGVTGQRGRRDGDIGTESVPISRYFQFQPQFANGNRLVIGGDGFVLAAPAALIAGTVPAGAQKHLAAASDWDSLPALLAPSGATPDTAIVVGRAPLQNSQPAWLALQRLADAARSQASAAAQTYAEVGAPRPATRGTPLAPRFKPDELPALFAKEQAHFKALRHQIRINTPDPYLNAAVGAINVVSDALWDDDAKAILHGAVAWRVPLLGWRGAYALDALGWHDRAKQNIETWIARQNVSPIPAQLPPPEAETNLARSRTALHSNGNLTASHYDMNMVFFDALFRHLLWTGDLNLARRAWPVIQRHLAWEQRLFRRDFDGLPLYEGYANFWASDDVFYGGGGTTHASAYNYYAFRSAARLAKLLGEDGSAYHREADLIAQAMRKHLWMPDRGAFGEYRDSLGLQRLHTSYGLWSFYTTVDSEVPTPQEAMQMTRDVFCAFKPIPVHGAGVPKDVGYRVLPSTDWMPYAWSVNNVVMGENLHTALAMWQANYPEYAFTLAKSALMASMNMGITPGNVGSMNYLDHYRRESQRDFADGTGVTARALVEGLFGVKPDALAGVMTVQPGFPSAWNDAELQHPGVGLVFKREGMRERWQITQPAARFKQLRIRFPAWGREVESVTWNGRPVAWKSNPATHMVLLEQPWAGQATVVVQWRKGQWPNYRVPNYTQGVTRIPNWTVATDAVFESISLGTHFNDRVTDLFKPGKYLTPRPSGVSLTLPSQGAGAWAGHVNELPAIDDSGLRRVAAEQGGAIKLPNGLPFATPAAPEARNIAFTSRWDNYPREISIPLTGQARHAYLLMAGTTNFMQSRIDNGEVIVEYADGSQARLALHNPTTWWPIEQDYFIDDYQFQRPGPTPPRVDLKTGLVRLQPTGRAVPGGAATVLDLPLDPAKSLARLTLRTLSNDVVIGLMSLTLDRRLP
ncbi:hypothetical protein J2X21_002575 [Kinneretia asaccharophila]|uniref:DUF4450 domain-containing protein n=1 Tax=Roseateles asaccharophilus TaxID=582607 RepID=A0ABU2A8B1_9BURK|nr:hypothetical protein [Roseateles asaccharophilus]